MAPSYTSSDMTDAGVEKSTNKKKKERKKVVSVEERREKGKEVIRKKFAPSVKVGAG